MAQITGSRSEFMTSDLSDIEYKRKGGCFLSYKKIAVIISLFVIGIVTAGVIGAYMSPVGKTRSFTVSTFAEDDVDGLGTKSKFSSSPSVLPTSYTIELTPVLEESTVKKFSGRVIVRFNYNGTQPLSQLVFNAKGMNVSNAKLFSVDDKPPENVHSRKRRNDAIGGNSDSDGTNSTDSTITDIPVANLPEVTADGNKNDVDGASTADDVFNATSTDAGSELRFNNSSSNENSTAVDIPSLTSTPADVFTMENKTYSDKSDSRVSTSSGDQPGPIFVQKIPPSVISTSRPILLESEIRTKSTEIRIGIDETDPVDGFYVIYPDTPIRRGNYSVEITYETDIDGENTFANSYQFEGQSKWLLATKLKPLGPRTLFPSFDQPNSKPRFSLSVARPKSLIALANMPLQSSDSVSDDWVMDHFEKSPPLSPSDLAFLVGDVQPIREINTGDTKIPLTLWGSSKKTEETHFIANKMETVIGILNQFISTPYTMPKLDVVGMPGLTVDGMGSSGLISIRENLFYMKEEESSAISKDLAVKNLVKLIGEQWLGGLVSTKTLSDAWIFEGSLIYLEHLLTDKINEPFDVLASFGIIQHDALEADAYGISKTLDSKLTFASSETKYPENSYKKGACLIRMLHNVISDSGFRNGYKKFLSRWLNANAGVSDFWKAMSDEAKWLPNGISLAEVMTSWVSQGGFPLVTIQRNHESGSAVVTQERFALDNSTISKRQFWYIPLTYILDGDDWSSPRRSWFIREEEIKLEDLGKGEEKKWVLFNVNQTGYYRVNYDLDNWNLLSVALNSTFEKFPVTARTSLVDDALSLAWGGRLEYPTALNLIRYLEEKETHHSPWTAALQNMIELNNLLQNTPAYSSFQEFMIKFISPLLKKVTSTREDTQLKLMAIKWACLIDNPECRSYVKNLSSVPSYLTETYECALAKFGGKSEWDSLLSKTSKAEDRETKLRLLAAFPCFQVQWILQSILDDILKGEIFDVQETLVLLGSFSENPTASKTAFKFLRSHWKAIFERFSKSYPISKGFLTAAIKGITDDQDLKDIFKEDNYETLKFMGHTITLAEAETGSRISWLKTNLLPVESWFNDYIIQAS